MIEGAAGPSGTFTLLAAVRGVAAEVPELLDRLAASSPAAVGIGISPEELAGVVEHFVDRPTEPLVPLAGTEAAEVRGLVRYGEVRVPSPAVLGIVGWAKGRDLPVEGLDASDGEYADLFADHISYWELVRRTLRERRLTRAPPTPGTPDAFSLEWHARLSPGRGSRAFDRARDALFAERARALGARVPGRVALLVDRERFDSVRRALAEPGSGGGT